MAPQHTHCRTLSSPRPRPLRCHVLSHDPRRVEQPLPQPPHPAYPAVPGVPEILHVPEVAPTTLDPNGSPAIHASPAILAVPAIPATYRPMTDWIVPTPPTSTGHTVRDAYKRAFEKHQVFSQASIILSQTLLVSIGPDLTTQLSDPLTGTFDLTPIAIMNVMATLYGDGNLTVQDLERLRLPLKTKLLSLARRAYIYLSCPFQADQFGGPVVALKATR